MTKRSQNERSLLNSHCHFHVDRCLRNPERYAFANIVNLDQTVPRSSLVRLCTVCQPALMTFLFWDTPAWKNWTSRSNNTLIIFRKSLWKMLTYKSFSLMFQCTFFSLFYYCCWKYRKEQNMLPCQRGPPLNPKDYTYTNLTPLVFTMSDFEVHGYLEHNWFFGVFWSSPCMCRNTCTHHYHTI